MVWMPDDQWYAQQKGKGMTSGMSKGKGKGINLKGGDGGWGGGDGWEGGGDSWGGGGDGWGGGGGDEQYDAYLCGMMHMMMMKGKGKGKGKGKDKGKDKGKGKGKVKQEQQQFRVKGEPQEKREKKPMGLGLPGAEKAPFRARLNQAMQQKHKVGSVKGWIVYTTEKGEDGYTYTSTVQCEKFDMPYASEGPAVTIKQAEESAAGAAMKAEFPELYDSAPEALKNAALGAELLSKPESKEKRKLSTIVGAESSNERDGSDAKGKLNIGMTIMMGRSLTKGEIEYSLEEKDDGSVKASVKIVTDEGEQTFTGQPVQGSKPNTRLAKRQAEINAAEVALKAYSDTIEAMLPEYEAKKEAKNLAQAEIRAAKRGKIVKKEE